MADESGMIFYPIYDHAQYESLLLRLRKLSRYVVLVQIDGEAADDPHVLQAMETMVLVDKKPVCKWLGTDAFGRAVQYEFFLNTKAFFNYLLQYPSFFFNERLDYSSIEDTSFGLDDIAFLDKDRKPLFYTTTHEGLAWVRPDVLNVDLSYLRRQGGQTGQTGCP
jgi:hypothetical protein